MATTVKKEISEKAKTAAQRWAEGTAHYQEAYASTASKIHDKAREMRDSGADPADIVAMAIEENVNFAREYHDHQNQQ